jgi:GNAT superfamily N-acetyltransferase
VTIRFEWRGAFDNAALNALHAEGFEHRVLADDWWGQVNRHSLGWVCAWDDVRGEGGRCPPTTAQAEPNASADLVGFVNVPWDGAVHAFILDTLTAQRARRQGIGRELVAVAAREAAAAGCEWLHVDFEEHLSEFYLGACGFTPTPAGLIALK